MMVDPGTDTPEDLLTVAEATYQGVVSDPLRYAGSAAVLLDRARRDADPQTVAVALRARAWALHSMLDNAGALVLLTEGVRLTERHGLHRRLGDLLVSRAATWQELGRHAAARTDLRRAADLVSDGGRADVMLQLATLEYNAGRLPEAADLYGRVLAEPGCSALTWLKAANNRANAQIHLGRAGTTLADLERAAELAEGFGPLLQAVITNTRAMATFQTGDVVTSLRLFDRAGPLYLAAGVPPMEHYLDYADALVDLRLLTEARATAEQAAAEFEQHGARLMAAEAQLRCARLALVTGEGERAVELAEQAVQEFRRQRRTAWVARATVAAVEARLDRHPAAAEDLARLGRAAGTLRRMGLHANAVEAHLTAGRTALDLGRTAVARRHLQHAAALGRGQSLVVRLRSRVAAALAAGLAGPAAAADVLAECRHGLTDLGRHRIALPSVELRVLASGHGAELGQIALRAVLPSGRADRALAWMERTRAAALVAVDDPPAAVSEDLEALRAVESQLRAARRETGAEPADLRARRTALEHRIRRESWTRDGAVGGGAAPVTARELQDRLAGGVLVEFAVLDGAVVAVAVGAGRPRLVPLGAEQDVRTEVDAWRFAVRRLLRGGRHAGHAREAADLAAGRLRRLLLGPLGLAPGQPLVVVPAGVLNRLPWTALHDGPVSVAPSAAFWSRSRDAVAAPTRVAVVAGPELAAATEEADLVAQVHRASRRRTRCLAPPDSTVDAALELLGSSDLAHLACHGTLRADNPLFSSLLLSDGPLTVHELVSRSRAPHRVILAACDSGVQRQYDGEEVLGLVSALMSRGAAGVVASVVPVPDGASVALMQRLHEGLDRGLTTAAALDAARGSAGWDGSAAADGGMADYLAAVGFVAFGAA